MVLFSDAILFCIFSITNYAILVTIVFFVRAVWRCCERHRKRFVVAALLTKIPRALYVVPSSSPPPPSPPVSAVVPEPDVESCIICMDEFVSGEELWVLPRCKHLFHGVCIERWVLAPSMTCPVCRNNVTHGEATAPRSHNIDIDTKELHFLVSTSLSDVAASLFVINAIAYPPPSSPSSPEHHHRESCVICLEDFVAREKLWELPQCKHRFHEKCIRDWLLLPSNTCPICRTPLARHRPLSVNARRRRRRTRTGSFRLPDDGFYRLF
ncbi:hypothetical protein BHM03_00040667 [Ensete ventricosum]|nr:hypothetical protein BHM03_00040667 [Ensete ventricosum]